MAFDIGGTADRTSREQHWTHHQRVGVKWDALAMNPTKLMNIIYSSRQSKLFKYVSWLHKKLQLFRSASSPVSFSTRRWRQAKSSVNVYGTSSDVRRETREMHARICTRLSLPGPHYKGNCQRARQPTKRSAAKRPRWSARPRRRSRATSTIGVAARRRWARTANSPPARVEKKR